MKDLAFEQFESLEERHWWFRGRRAVYLELLRGALQGVRPARVLDLGAGVGGFLEELGRLGDQVHYTELVPEALRCCAKRGAGAGVLADGTALPFAEMSFDVVCLFDVLEHIEDHEAVLNEVARVLNPQGIAIVSVPAHPWLWSENDRISEHVRRYTRRELREVVDDAQLVLERCTYTNAALFPAIAGFVLAAETARRLHLTPGHATNLSVPMPRSLDQLFYRVFVAELAVSRKWDLPFGHSLCAVVRRREKMLKPVGRVRRLARAATLSAEGSLTGV